MQNSLFDLDPDPTPPKALQDLITPDPTLRTRARNAGGGVVVDRVRPEKPKSEIQQAIPDGYFRVTAGPLLPDDLVWDCMNKRFLANDSDQWNDARPADVDGLVYVVRSVRSITPAGDRRYTLRR